MLFFFPPIKTSCGIQGHSVLWRNKPLAFPIENGPAYRGSVFDGQFMPMFMVLFQSNSIIDFLRLSICINPLVKKYAMANR